MEALCFKTTTRPVVADFPAVPLCSLWIIFESSPLANRSQTSVLDIFLVKVQELCIISVVEGETARHPSWDVSAVKLCKALKSNK